MLECGRRRMTRVVCESGQPRRMETCGAEEPYEGNLHVRFCGGCDTKSLMYLLCLIFRTQPSVLPLVLY